MNTRRYLTARCRPPVCIVAMAALCVIAAGAVELAVEEEVPETEFGDAKTEFGQIASRPC